MNTHNGHPSLKEVSLGDAEVRSQCSQRPPGVERSALNFGGVGPLTETAADPSLKCPALVYRYARERAKGSSSCQCRYTFNHELVERSDQICAGRQRPNRNWTVMCTVYVWPHTGDSTLNWSEILIQVLKALV